MRYITQFFNLIFILSKENKSVLCSRKSNIQKIQIIDICKHPFLKIISSENCVRQFLIILQWNHPDKVKWRNLRFAPYNIVVSCMVKPEVSPFNFIGVV